MRMTRPVLTIAFLGIALTLGTASFGEPKGEKPSPGEAGKKPKPDKGPADRGPGGPAERGQGAGPGAPGPGGKGPGDRGADGRGPDGKGPGGPGRGPDGAPGLGAGEPGDGPMGIPFKRRAELEEKEKAGTLTDQEKAELERLKAIGPGHAKRREARAARLAELEEKEKGGKLTEDEKTELEAVKKVQERHALLQKKHAERKADRDQRKRSAKRDALKRFPGVGKHPSARDEFRKHAHRMARLERAREVAEAEGKTEVVTRIDALIEKEKARHEKWLEKQSSKETKGATP